MEAQKSDAEQLTFTPVVLELTDACIYLGLQSQLWILNWGIKDILGYYYSIQDFLNEHFFWGWRE